MVTKVEELFDKYSTDELKEIKEFIKMFNKSMEIMIESDELEDAVEDIERELEDRGA